VKAERSKKGAAINLVLPLSLLEVEIAAENMRRAFSPSCKRHASLCMTHCRSVTSWGGMGALKIRLWYLRDNKSYPRENGEPMPTFLHREMGSRRDPAAGVRRVRNTKALNFFPLPVLFLHSPSLLAIFPFSAWERK